MRDDISSDGKGPNSRSGSDLSDFDSEGDDTPQLSENSITDSEAEDIRTSAKKEADKVILPPMPDIMDFRLWQGHVLEAIVTASNRTNERHVTKWVTFKQKYERYVRQGESIHLEEGH